MTSCVGEGGRAGVRGGDEEEDMVSWEGRPVVSQTRGFVFEKYMFLEKYLPEI